MTVLIAPDKFKGSLSARAVADHIAIGLASRGVASVSLPLADGGDGSVDAAISSGFRAVPIVTVDAHGHLLRSRIAFNDHTAVVEVANTCGLATIQGIQSDALAASSRGFGLAISAAIDLGAKRIVLCLGGSASTDGGMGMLSALGVRFFDSRGRLLHSSGASTGLVAFVDQERVPELNDIELIVASDVTNPLTGPNGAASVYGPQKGATQSQIVQLETNLVHFANITQSQFSPNLRPLHAQAGAGSAGGIGFAAILLGARMESGAEFFLDLLQFDKHAERIELVVTGEGSFDEQSVSGKLPTVVAQRAAPRRVVAVAGRSRISDADAAALGFESVYSVSRIAGSDTSENPALTALTLKAIGVKIADSL